MDDLDLEARLRTRLHSRFDDVPVPNGLTANVSQTLATAARPVGFAAHTTRLRLGWAAIAAAVVIALGAVAIGKGLVLTGPGGVATPTPTATSAPERDFIVLPPVGGSVNKPEAILATDVFGARIQALGIGTFSSGGGYGIQFRLPADGPSDASIRAVLGATGDVRFVPLPTSDYGDGKLTATVGAPLPKDEPALFGWEGIASIQLDTTNQTPGILVTLKTAAGRAVGDYTTSHIGETLAIVLDGRVAMLPMTTSPITSGQILVNSGQSNGPGASDPSFDEAAAILVGGMLPEAWRGASVPVIVSRDAAIAAALAATGGGTVQDASPTVDLGPLSGDLRAVWYVDVDQPECPDTQSCIGEYLRVRVDAVTGLVIDVGPQAS